jgi:hypothetical protein
LIDLVDISYSVEAQWSDQIDQISQRSVDVLMLILSEETAQ